MSAPFRCPVCRREYELEVDERGRPLEPTFCAGLDPAVHPGEVYVPEPGAEPVPTHRPHARRRVKPASQVKP